MHRFLQASRAYEGEYRSILDGYVITACEPRFYFDVTEDSDLSQDRISVECGNLEAAEYEAAKGAAEFAEGLFPKGSVREVTVEIRDENGFQLVTATVSLTIRRTIHALA